MMIFKWDANEIEWLSMRNMQRTFFFNFTFIKGFGPKKVYYGMIFVKCWDCV